MPSNQLISELGAGGVVGYALVVALTYAPGIPEIADNDQIIIGGGVGIFLTFIAKVIRKVVGLGGA